MIINEQLGLSDNHGMRMFANELIDAQRPVNVMLLDIDDFKKINDEHGHDVGDELIVLIANALKQMADAYDGNAFRNFGDEFGLVIPDLTLEEVFLKAEDFRKQIVEQQTSDIHGTVSIGVANAPRDGKDVEGVIRSASAALYTAKENGRNRVALPPSEDMIMKTCYYPSALINRLKQIAARVGKKESVLLREALENLLRQYDDLREV
nr:GGDEF domain protein [uncultured bacterium]